MGEDLWLRGVYLTSATQTGSPIDQLTSELSQVFGIAEVEQSHVGGDGTSFFVRELFRKKIFPEQHLVGESKRFEMLSGWAMKGAALLGFAAIIASTLVWFAGFRHSQAALNGANDSLTEAESLLPAAQERTDLNEVLEYLAEVRVLRDSSKSESDDLDITRHLGLSALPDLKDGSETLYADALRDYFVPHLVALLYEELVSLRNGDQAGEMSLHEWELHDLTNINKN